MSSKENKGSADIILRYAVTRALLQRWSGYMWRTRLWKYHAGLIGFGLGVSGLFYVEGRQPFFAPLAGALGVIGVLLIVPQLAYKPQTRELILSSSGWKTTIGRRSGGASWSEVAEITDRGGYIAIIRKNLNALIIPNAAFGAPEQRGEILARMREWLAATTESIQGPKG